MLRQRGAKALRAKEHAISKKEFHRIMVETQPASIEGEAALQMQLAAQALQDVGRREAVVAKTVRSSARERKLPDREGSAAVAPLR